MIADPIWLVELKAQRLTVCPPWQYVLAGHLKHGLVALCEKKPARHTQSSALSESAGELLCRQHGCVRPTLQKELAGHASHAPLSAPVKVASQRQRSRESLQAALEALAGHGSHAPAPDAPL